MVHLLSSSPCLAFSCCQTLFPCLQGSISPAKNLACSFQLSCCANSSPEMLASTNAGNLLPLTVDLHDMHANHQKAWHSNNKVLNTAAILNVETTRTQNYDVYIQYIRSNWTLLLLQKQFIVHSKHMSLYVYILTTKAIEGRVGEGEVLDMKQPFTYLNRIIRLTINPFDMPVSC